MKIRILFTALILLGFNSISYGDEKCVDSLVVLDIENESLGIILDEIIEEDSKLNFYNTELIYYIFIQQQGRSWEVLISTTEGGMTKGRFDLGCIVSKKNVFIVTGAVFNETFFRKTKSYLSFEWVDSISPDIDDLSTRGFIFQDNEFFEKSIE